MRESETIEDVLRIDATDTGEGPPIPGLVLIFSNGKPAFALIPLDKGSIELGRGEIASVPIHDKRMSRAHAHISFDGAHWRVRDLDSRNGTSADGEEVSGQRVAVAKRFVRTGASLFLLATDTRAFQRGIARAGNHVLGPALQRTFESITRFARSGKVLHVTGETGSGKELAARAFHDASPKNSGPFIAVNGANLKESTAEAELFGSRKGAYTDAVHRDGHVLRAHGGTLFLDEIAELNLAVQATLLRVLQEHEVWPLGAKHPEKVDFWLCTATHADLRHQVMLGRMREDLYHRIATPTVILPPLRGRLEEIPWLVEQAVNEVRDAAGELAMHVSFVEACLLRHWPGNVRELLGETKTAAQQALEDGGVVLARHLGPRAGMAFTAAQPSTPEDTNACEIEKRTPSDEEIAEVLRTTSSVAEAARALGMHRTQLNRWRKRKGLLE